MYGKGFTALAADLGVPVVKAKEILESFKQKFYGVQEFFKRVVKECEKTGYVRTLRGRMRHLPQIRSLHVGQRNKAQRQAINTVCQGSAADIMKVAMIKIHDCIATLFSSTSRMISTAPHECDTPPVRLVLQIHDELIFEVRKDIVEVAKVCDLLHVLFEFLLS